MRAGRLRHLVTLSRDAGSVPNEYGETTPGWVDVDQAYADISPMSLVAMKGAKETLLAGAEVDQDMVALTMYPRDDVTAAWRVSCEGKVYDVKAVRVNNAGSDMTLLCTVGTVG